MTLGDKQEWRAIDFCKFICAIMVIAIHCPPLDDFSNILSFALKNIFCRVAVPFFFIAAGFFFTNKANQKRKAMGYVSRLLILYVIYTFVYMPLAWMKGWMNDLKTYIRKSIMIRSYIHLWFFVALIMAVILLCFCVNQLHITDKVLLIISVILYSVGVAGNAYITMLPSEIQNNVWIGAYYKYFETTRNGIFFGFPLVAIGYLIGKNKKKIYKCNYFKWTLLFFAGTLLETLISVRWTGLSSRDISFMLFPTSISMFLWIAFIPMNRKVEFKVKKLRKLSTLVFAWQYMAIVGLEKFTLKFGIVINSLEKYIIVVIVSLIISEIILKLSQYRYSAFLKYLY